MSDLTKEAKAVRSRYVATALHGKDSDMREIRGQLIRVYDRLVEEIERLELHFNVPSCTNPICDCTEAQLHRAHEKVAALEAREQRIRGYVQQIADGKYDARESVRQIARHILAQFDAPFASEKDA